MPPSTRRQTAAYKQQKLKAQDEMERRKRSFNLLQKGRSVRDVAEQCGISKTTCGRISLCLRQNKKGELSRLLDPLNNRRGRQTVWTKEESEALNKRIIYAAEKGFAVDIPTLQSILQQICADGRKTYANGLPSTAAIRTYRALNRELTCRKAENKEAIKIKAENYFHVESFADALKEIETRHPGIFQDASRLWNMDETHVDGEFGHRVKVMSSAKSNHGGAYANFKGSGKHFTAVIAASAAGHLAPLFAIAAGKNVMHAWTEPLSKQFYVTEKGVPHWLTEASWLPQESVIRCTEHGSVEMDTMPHIIEHIDRFARQFVPLDKAYVLFLDGHSSRKGIEWVEKAKKHNIKVVVLPANTTHFLQPCDNRINKCFQKGIRDTRDKLLSMASTNVHAMGFKLKLAVAGHTTLTAQIVSDSFVETGIWPMDYRFLSWLKSREVDRQLACESLASRINAGGPSSCIRTDRKRLADGNTWQNIQGIVASTMDKSRALQEIREALHDNSTVNAILGTIGPRPVASTTNRSKTVLGCGAPAACWTVGNLLQQRKLREKAAEEAILMKEREKQLKREKREAKKVAKEVPKRLHQEEMRNKKEEKAARVSQKKRKRGHTTSTKAIENPQKRGKTTSQEAKVDLNEAAKALVSLGSLYGQ